MAMLESEVTANFYNLIHQLVEAAELGEAAERRGDHRRSFRSTQRIALQHGPGIPDESEFIDVRCHDLTGSGFSFLLSGPPKFDALVAAFGPPPHSIYIAARVSHCDKVLVHSSGVVERVDDCRQQTGRQASTGRDATPMVLVGCRFVKRLVK